MNGRRIRILFVVGNFVAGGAERHLLELWSRLDRSRFEVAIACFEAAGQFAADVRGLGWPVHDLGVGRRMYGPRGVRGFLRLLHLALELRPDVIHGYLQGPNLFAALAGRLARVPAVVVAKRNVDAFETARQIAAQRFAHRLATHVTAVSENVAETVVALGVARRRITVIPNGVDVERFAGGDRAAPALARRAGVPMIGSVGCLAPRKDQRTLLEALAVLAGRGLAFEAVLVGDGPERSALERRAEELGIAGRVRFLGERPDVEHLLPAMDVFVLSSREEGIPNALLEAMASGVPCVAPGVGDVPELVDDTGVVVRADDPEALAAGWETLAAMTAQERRALGDRARARAADRYGLDRATSAFEALYEAAAGG